MSHSAASKMRRAFLLAGVAGLLVAVPALIANPTLFFHAYLFAFLFWISISAGAIGLKLIHNLTGGVWGQYLDAALLPLGSTMPFTALLFIPIAFGLRFIYPWATLSNNPHPRFYNTGFFIGRSIVYFGLLILIWRKASIQALVAEPNSEGCAPRTSASGAVSRNGRLLSGWGSVAYVMILTFASLDWVMSLDPHWSSTIYGMLWISGAVLSATTASIALLPQTSAQDSTPKARLDSGNLLFAFLFFWAYLAFMQFLIIWMGNTTEEITWIIQRESGAFGIIAILLIVAHFALPFCILLFRASKLNPKSLRLIAGGLLGLRLLDYLWQTGPAQGASQSVLMNCWAYLSVLLLTGGLWCWQAARQLSIEERRG